MFEKINNNTIGLIIVGIIGIAAVFTGQADSLALAVVTGIVGFLKGREDK